MKKTNLLILLLVVLVSLLGIVIYQQNRQGPEENPVPAPLAEPDPIKKPIVHYPVPATAPDGSTTAAFEERKAEGTAAAKPAPAEMDDGRTIEEALPLLVAEQGMLNLLNLEDFIPRFVAMIDNLPEKRLPRASLPIKPPGGPFIVSGTDEEPQTSTRNHKRYQPYVNLLENIKPGLVINSYTRFYPLFQKAYEQLGYKNAYFNDRLIFTLDHLLETPEPKEPILLAQPSVLYTYADPLLENRSAGQKILFRIGPENRAKVLSLLSDYRRRLTSLHP